VIAAAAAKTVKPGVTLSPLPVGRRALSGVRGGGEGGIGKACRGNSATKVCTARTCVRASLPEPSASAGGATAKCVH